MPQFRPPLRSLRRDDRGAIAVMFALMLVPLLLAIGVAIDYSRGQQFHSALQQAVDAAALAGASAYVGASSASTATAVANGSMNAGIAQLPPYQGSVSFTVTPSVTTTSGGATAYQVAVSAQGAVATTVLQLLTSSIATSASATAINPVTADTVTLPQGKSSAWDRNTVYWYIVPTNGSLPVLSSSNIIYSNAANWNAASASTPSAQASQKIGFALVNVTGGNQGYGSNGFGASQGTTHVFYSSVSPPSANAADSTDRSRETYSSETRNCSLQVAVVANLSSLPIASSGSCFNSLPNFATPTCAQLSTQTVEYFWNDMGGGSDDYDYNDAVYTVSCKASGNGSAGPTGVILTR